MNSPESQRIVVGISGASGAAYAQRLIALLLQARREIHLVVSPLGSRLLHDELGYEAVNLDTITGKSADQREQDGDRITMHNFRDVGASIASGSFVHQGMIICPCSSNTLAAIASGLAQNLMHRAAYVTLKERRRLVLVHREMPITNIDLDNMKRISDAGGIIAPASPGFYLLPQTVEDIVDFVAARCLDLLDVPHELNVRWPPSTDVAR